MLQKEKKEQKEQTHDSTLKKRFALRVNKLVRICLRLHWIRNNIVKFCFQNSNWAQKMEAMRAGLEEGKHLNRISDNLNKLFKIQN